MKAKLMRVFEWRVWHLYLLAGVASLTLLIVGAAFIAGSLYLRSQSRSETERNAKVNAIQNRALQNLSRIQKLENPPPVTDEQLARASARALRACVADPACRRALRGSIRGARLRASDFPSLAPEPPSGSTGGSSGGAQGPDSGSSNPGTTPAPRRPGSGPRPAPRPTPPAPTAPGPTAPPAPTPAPARPTPAPPQSTPPVGPVPPVTVPPVTPPALPPIQVCTPVVQVNCADPKSGKVVGPDGHAADPNSDRGRSNEDEPLCERIKAVCPQGLIRFP